MNLPHLTNVSKWEGTEVSSSLHGHSWFVVHSQSCWVYLLSSRPTLSSFSFPSALLLLFLCLLSSHVTTLLWPSTVQTRRAVQDKGFCARTGSQTRQPQCCPVSSRLAAQRLSSAHITRLQAHPRAVRSLAQHGTRRNCRVRSHTVPSPEWVNAAEGTLGCKGIPADKSWSHQLSICQATPGIPRSVLVPTIQGCGRAGSRPQRRSKDRAAATWGKVGRTGLIQLWERKAEGRAQHHAPVLEEWL